MSAVGKVLLLGAVLFPLSRPARADYPCSSLSFLWRHGRIGLLDGRPIVTLGPGMSYLLRGDSDDKWVSTESSAPVSGPDYMPLEYDADPWKKPGEVTIGFAGAPVVTLRQVAKDISDDVYPERWAPQKEYVLTVGSQSSTVTLRDVYSLRAAVRHPTKRDLIYVLTQEPPGEEDSCGRGDGPGLVEIDIGSRRASLLPFPKRAVHGGIWSMQIVKNRFWMLTSSGVCFARLSGGPRTCWSYHSARVLRPESARPFLQDVFGRSEPEELPPIKAAMVKIVGGKERQHAGRPYFRIAHPAETDERGVYLREEDVEPILSRD